MEYCGGTVVGQQTRFDHPVEQSSQVGPQSSMNLRRPKGRERRGALREHRLKGIGRSRRGGRRGGSCPRCWRDVRRVLRFRSGGSRQQDPAEKNEKKESEELNDSRKFE